MKSGTGFFVRCGLLAVVGASVAGCGGSLSDYSLKDQQWFSGMGRTFTRSVAIEAPPLSQTKPLTPEDMLSPEGYCAGGPAQASEEAAPAGGPVALGHTECDVVRSAGQPSQVSVTADEQGRRLAIVTYASGYRAGVYHFTAGRLSSIEALPAPVAQDRSARRRR